MDALTPVLELLEAAGIRVTLDIAQLNPPGCLLGPPELDFRFNGGDFTATYVLIVTVGSTDRTKAIANLSDYLGDVLAALGDRPVTARPVDVTLADASTTLPGYELRWTTRIRRRNTP
jgi:hypothetical protein